MELTENQDIIKIVIEKFVFKVGPLWLREEPNWQS